MLLDSFSSNGVMSSRRSMTRDIHESIRLLLGKNVKILLKAPVKLELKGGDKTENRILVFTPHRLFVMTAKVPARIDHHFHYLDLRGVESRRPGRVAFCAAVGGEKTATYSFRPNCDEAADPEAAVDEVLRVLAAAVTRIFPGVPLERVVGKVDVQPADRPVREELLQRKAPDPKLVGPCGGFSAQYACLCDYYSLPFREEVAWDVDTIYFSHDSHEMCLQDFEHLDHRDQLCILSVLEHNAWFNRLKASGNNAKLPSDICERILQVVAKSPSLQELHVSSIGARWEFAARLAQAMSHNPEASLTSFDISCNFLEDKGLTHLSTAVSKHPKGLHHVNLSHCSLTAKGLSSFANALAANRSTRNTLTYLNLAGNSLKEESQALCSFLAQPNVIAILDLSATETPLDVLFGALVRGCTAALTHLNLSRNPFASKKAKGDIPAAYKQFFAGTLVLQYVNMSHCRMPAEAVKHLLLGLACNESTTNVELNLSNNQLSGNGAAVIESCLGGVRCISRLDLSENAIEAEMSGVMQGVARNRSLLSLNVSKNMTSVKPKHLPAVMESIVQLLQDEETALQKLNLSDCRLRTELNNVINALGSNQCLQHLDISGNQMGDVGARLLAKALQINTRLRIINLDRNAISLQGYTDITYALQSNFAMRHIPLPTFDLQPFIKTHPDRVDAVVHRMQELLQRNSSPHKFRNTAQAFRLTQGFLLSSTQQILDRVSAQTQDNIDTLVKLNVENSQSESVELAQGMISDAENSKHLLSALHEVTARGTDVDLKLKQVSLDLTNFVTSYIHQNVESMLKCAERQCPHIMKPETASGSKTVVADLRAACHKKCQVSPDFVSGLIMEQLGLEIHNKINELNLIIANHISDKVIDEVIEGLGAQSRTLVSQVGSLRKKRSLTPDVLKSGGIRGRSSSTSESLDQESTSLGGGSANVSCGASVSGGDGLSQKSESSPLSTPQTSKRKSLHGRKLRPKSHADGHHHREEGSEDDNEEVSANDEKAPTRNGEDDTVPELPAATALQHLGKARPKRAKRHAPTRGAVVPQSSDEHDEAIARFYTSPTATSLSPGSTPSGSPLQDVAQKEPGDSSREDYSLSPPEKKDEKRTGLLAGVKKSEEKITASPDSDRRSPLPFKDKPKTYHTSGFSCLASSTLDEDSPSLAKPSPEKRSLSPSLHSITDIFSKKDTSKHHLHGTSSPKPETKALISPGISPFASRKTEPEIQSSTSGGRRRSLNQEEEAATPIARTMSPPGAVDEGKRTPEGVVKRHGVGHGGNLDLMAEMKEKRASMVPKAGADGELSPGRGTTSSATSSSNVGNVETTKALFNQVKLR